MIDVVGGGIYLPPAFSKVTFGVLAMSNRNNSNNKGKSCLYVCPQCAGTGKVSGKNDDTDICGFDSKKGICPLCRGSGKFKRHRDHLHIHRRCRLKKIPLKKSRPGRGGRPSLGKNVLLQPGTPTTGYPEDDMAHKSQHQASTIQQQSHFDIDNGSDDLTCQENLPGELLQDQTTDEMKITSTTSDSSENLQPCNSGQKGALQPGLDIPALLRRAAALGIEPFFPLAPDDYREGVLPNVLGPPGTLVGPDEQLESPLLNATTPGALNQLDHFDVAGTPDPAYFELDTDVTGGIGP